MSVMSQPQDSSAHEGDRAGSTRTPRDEAAHVLEHALEEAHWARVRSEVRQRVTGFHGENFDERTARVENIVRKFNARAIKNARKNALRAGWTREELASAGLNADA